MQNTLVSSKPRTYSSSSCFRGLYFAGGLDLMIIFTENTACKVFGDRYSGSFFLKKNIAIDMCHSGTQCPRRNCFPRLQKKDQFVWAAAPWSVATMAGWRDCSLFVDACPQRFGFWCRFARRSGWEDPSRKRWKMRRWTDAAVRWSASHFPSQVSYRAPLAAL